MKLYIVLAVVAFALLVGAGWYAFKSNAPVQLPALSNTLIGSPQGQNESSAGTNSVADIDLAALDAEASQSAALSAQDGSQDAQAIAADGQAINSSIDSVSNPTQ